MPLVDCKWQSKFTLAAGAKMESDRFVREFEQLSGRAGIRMIPSLSSLNRRRTLVKPPCYTKKKKKTQREEENQPGMVWE